MTISRPARGDRAAGRLTMRYVARREAELVAAERMRALDVVAELGWVHTTAADDSDSSSSADLSDEGIFEAVLELRPRRAAEEAAGG